MKSASQETWVVKMITGNLKEQHDRRGHIQKNIKHRTFNTSKNARISRACQRK